MTRTTTTTSSGACAVEWIGPERFRLDLYVAPVPASRPRVTRWGVYYTKTYKAWMAAADASIPEANRTLEGTLGVRIEFVCHRPKTTKRITPNGDLDNHMKSILDALTKKGYWNDDMDIVEGLVTKRFAEPGETPHTSIYAWVQT